MSRNKIKLDFHFTTLKRFKIICERQRALYGIKCVLRIFGKTWLNIVTNKKKSTVCKHNLVLFYYVAFWSCDTVRKLMRQTTQKVNKH
jgi:hypothetical protein